MNNIIFSWRRSPTYQPYYVEKLIRTLQRTVDNPNIYVLTDENINFKGATTLVSTHPEWFGWWSIMEIFKPGLFPDMEPDECVFFLGLDTIITSPINDIFEIQSDFAAMPERPFNSSLIRYRPSKMGFLYEGMKQYWAGKIKGRFRGDQDLMAHLLLKKKYKWEYIRIPGIASYKHTCRGNEFDLETMRFIIFHGKPKPHEIPEDDPLREFWV